MTDYLHEESETDRLADKWDGDRFKRPSRVNNGMCEHGACDWCPQGCFDDVKPMTSAERNRIIKRISEKIEAL